MNGVIFKKINEEEADSILDAPYNMPTVHSRTEEESFFSKWHKARDLIKKSIDDYGVEDELGGEDYTISDKASLSRWVSVVVQNKNILSRPLFGDIQKCLNEMPDSFIVHMWVEDPDGVDSHLFIESEKIRGYVSGFVDELMCD